MPYTLSLLLLCLLAVLSACSGSKKEHVTHREYKVQVGGWQDMDEYKKLREKAIEDKDRGEDDVIECNIIDCPEMIRKDGIQN